MVSIASTMATAFSKDPSTQIDQPHVRYMPDARSSKQSRG
jgi:hypothetical protein